jgi:tRNA(Arg) A34 adenosine deaminase TadA
VNFLRRRVLASAGSFMLAAPFASAEPTFVPDARWYTAALAMRELAQQSGDQPYGAVVVAGDAVIGEAPSRVVQRGDPDAHAEREALRDAQRRLGRTSLAGSILYATSRPCRACEAAAAHAGIERMVYGPALVDAGRPVP